jgi:hypothetical protein
VSYLKISFTQADNDHGNYGPNDNQTDDAGPDLKNNPMLRRLFPSFTHASTIRTGKTKTEEYKCSGDVNDNGHLIVPADAASPRKS